MNLLGLLSEQKLTAAIVRNGAKPTMARWTSTAMELSRTRHREIDLHHRSFVGVTDDNFSPDQVIWFLGGLLALLDTDDERRRLIHAEGSELLK